MKIKLKFVCLKSMHHHPPDLCASLKSVASYIWLTKMVDLLGHGVNRMWYGDLNQWNKANSLAVPIKGALKRYLNILMPWVVCRQHFSQFKSQYIHIFLSSFSTC